ncbi:putative dehydrogenase [Aliiruegeria haliotis]|uniref:Putative dehydrogenase n=1 Tax=Aliiruegeria haliotis TaxID=1280846 RepID=A0A2T0S0L2_9RHOB|nr:Gfo/Idh/MocA family oxidoreductase [Aliiruegeria haliotis]PRY26964.1 putative dehydrogenase [Aliiruegeria haliotis]
MKAALIGPGTIAETHAAAIAASRSGVELHGVLARQRHKAAAFAETWAEPLGDTPRTYTDIQEIAVDTAVDFAIICTPPDVRMALVSPLAAAGIPILLEKPIERTTEAARDVVETCERAGVPLGIVFHHRARTTSIKAAELMQGGALGSLAAVEARIPLWRPQSYYDEPGRGDLARDGGGVLLTQAIHPMELMLHLAGRVSRVTAMARTTAIHQMETEDFVSAGLDFENGATGSLFATTAAFPGGRESLTFHCQNASLTVGARQLEVHWRDGRHEVHGEDASRATPINLSHTLHQAMIEDFVDALISGRPPHVTGRQALHVHDLIAAIMTASATGAPVDIPT